MNIDLKKLIKSKISQMSNTHENESQSKTITNINNPTLCVNGCGFYGYALSKI